MFTLTELTEGFMERYFNYCSLMSPQILLRMLYSIPVFFTYSLTPWSRDLFEKLTSSQVVKKLPLFMEP